MIEFTSDMDERIRALYTPPYVRGAISAQARAWNIRIECLTHRARTLGLKPISWCVGSIKWSAEEIRLLRSVPHKTNREASNFLKRKGFNRTPDAVRNFRLRDGWRNEIDRDPTVAGYSAKAIGELLGVDASTIVRFIRLGYIKARRENNHVEQGVPYRVSQKHLYEFLTQHVHRWEPAKADKYWLVDFLTNTKAMNC